MTDDLRVSVSTELKVEEYKAGLYSRIAFGGFCILSGFGVAVTGIFLDHKKDTILHKSEGIWTLSHILMGGGTGLILFGGMLLPGVFDAAKPVIMLVFPNGIPMIGGRRSTDPQPVQKNDSLESK